MEGNEDKKFCPEMKPSRPNYQQDRDEREAQAISLAKDFGIVNNYIPNPYSGAESDRRKGSECQVKPSTKAQEISADMMNSLQLVMDGRPAIVIVDDGKQNLCHVQGLSLPTIIGLFTIHLKSWKDKAFRHEP